ncbi:hypothetical protein MMH89_02185 [Candidatus Comchoanobacter bicostacola]|uniref:Apea-like HEPN domain-containing protein n=1 Tax=Candidatus Comchoanobacter bicostacola TaxID=2919598 RepID=A0ABY5DMV2_9GAMM|nr:hypothetical protein [Candidatus Comchoanobacter bicostacola]UTC24956.1 hypothetical protein MMH89_02185 [Candidatus Comchoanobacter bicostacola]
MPEFKARLQESLKPGFKAAEDKVAGVPVCSDALDLHKSMERVSSLLQSILLPSGDVRSKLYQFVMLVELLNKAVQSAEGLVLLRQHVQGSKNKKKANRNTKEKIKTLYVIRNKIVHPRSFDGDLKDICSTMLDMLIREANPMLEHINRP